METAIGEEQTLEVLDVALKSAKNVISTATVKTDEAYSSKRSEFAWEVHSHRRAEMGPLMGVWMLHANLKKSSSPLSLATVLQSSCPCPLEMSILRNHTCRVSSIFFEYR